MKRGITTSSLVGATFGVASAVTLAVFGLYFYVAGGVAVFSDGIGYYAPLRSLLFDGNLDVSDELQYFAETSSELSKEPRWPGPILRYSKYTIGMAVVLFPFFMVGHLSAILFQALGFPTAANGLSWTYEFFYCIGSILLGICGLYLCYRGARAKYGAFPAAVAVVGAWFGSPLFYYLAIVPSMSHAVSQFLVSAFLYLSLTQDWSRRRGLQLLLGVTLGLAALVRPQNVLFAVVPFALMLLNWRDDGKVELTDLLSLCVVGCIAVLTFLPQLLIYGIEFGDLTGIPYWVEGATGQRSTSFDWLHPRIAAVSFSGFHGLFAWHPIILLAIVGAILSVRKDKQFIALLLAFLLQVYLVSSWYNWWQGASFGGRMFCSSTYIFVLGLASLWSRAKGALTRQLAVLVTLVFIIWNLLLVLQFASGMIPAAEPVSMVQIVKNQPRAIPFFLSKYLYLLEN